MGEPIPDGLSKILKELSVLVVDQEGLEETVGRVTRLARRSLEGCDAAGISLVEGERVTTAAATDQLVGDVDAAQYQTGQGPCLEAIRQNTAFRVGSMAQETRFPQWSPRALEAGVQSSFSVPLRVGDRIAGALNLYSQREDGFKPEDEPLGWLLAEQAAVALHNAQTYDDARRLTEQLTAALGTRGLIGQALGILMHREGISADVAFELLKAASQNTNMKLRDVAQRVVDEQADDVAG